MTSCQILNLPDCPPRDLAGDIQLALAEMSDGDRSEAELKALIRDLIESSDIVICESAPCSVSAGTTNPAPIILDTSILITLRQKEVFRQPVW